MNLTPLQIKAFDIAMRPQTKIIRIAGYAGTGKTTVLAEVAKEYGHRCVVLAYTNKAVSVLKSKGIKAQTIHSLLYAPQEFEVEKLDKDGSIVYHKDDKGNLLLDRMGNKVPVLIDKGVNFSLKTDPDAIPKIGIIDESSMVGKKIWDDLLAVFETIIFFGDPFQLPPVMDKEIFNSEKPTIFLDEIHRTAWDNPIIRMSKDIRDGKEPDWVQYIRESPNKEIRHTTFKNTNLYPYIVANDVQMICGTNKKRHELNEAIRKQKGYKENTIVIGEKVICTKNLWSTIETDLGTVSNLAFYNGQMLELMDNIEATDNDFKSIISDIKNHGRYIIQPFWNKDFFKLYDAPNSAWWNKYKEQGLKKDNASYGLQLDYSYAVTAHKAQGSEYPEVAVFDERDGLGGTRQEKQRWLYTSVTRAKRGLIMVQKDRLIV